VPRSAPLIALLALLAACGAPPPPTAPAPAPAAAAAPIPMGAWPARSLTLGSPGRPPLAPLRMPTAAATQRLRFGSAAAVNGELGGAPVDAVRLQSERTLRVEVGPGPTGDQRALQFVVERYHDEAGLPAPEQGAIDAALTGLSGRWIDDARCGVVQAGAQPAEPPGDRLQQAILSGMVDLCPSLPAEDLGVGATWTTTVGGADPAAEHEVTTWTLLERGPGRVVLTFELRSTRTAADGLQRVNLGEGRLELRDGLPLPFRADARGRATRTSTTAGQPLTTTTEWSMFVETVVDEVEAPPPAAAP
jgi:hypothetical protein